MRRGERRQLRTGRRWEEGKAAIRARQVSGLGDTVL